MVRPAPGPTSAEELLMRPRPGGNTTMVLGSDDAQWIRDSQAVGVGSADAVASAESMVRPAPGGVDSVDFGSKTELLSKEELLVRPAVGGQTVVVLGGDQAAWTTDSGAIGVGSEEAVSPAGPRFHIPAVGGQTVVVLGGDQAAW